MTTPLTPSVEAPRKRWLLPAIVGLVIVAILILGYGIFSNRVPLDHVPPDPPGLVDGEQVYARSCQVCHGRDGRGSPGRNPPLNAEEWLEGDVPILVVLHGLQGPMEIAGVKYSGVMPPMGHHLSNAEIAAVLTYVRTSFGNDLGPVSVDEVAALRARHDPMRGMWQTDEILSLKD